MAGQGEVEEIEQIWASFVASPLPMALTDPEGRLLRVNAPLCALLDRTEFQLLDRNLDEVVDAEDQVVTREQFAGVVGGQWGHARIGHRLVRADGERIAVESHVWLVAGPDGRPLHVEESGRPRYLLHHFEDITEERHVRDAEERQTQARRVNDAVLQGLAVAKMAFDMGDFDRGRQALDNTFEKARDLVGRMLGETPVDPGRLRRSNPPRQ